LFLVYIVSSGEMKGKGKFLKNVEKYP